MSRHVVFMNWRDTANPEGGGSEVFVEEIARGLARLGHRVTIVCAAHRLAPADEYRDGIHFVRRGSRTTVYARGWWLARRRALGNVDAYVDVQNGLPFFVRLATRTPVIVLVHHVHKEQWPVVYPGMLGKIGWFLESRVARRAFSGSQYIAVSMATRAELIQIGVRAEDIAIVHNGNHPAPAVDVPRSASPLVCTVGRLVPHKQVEHAIDAVAELLPEQPSLRLVIVGDGWWRDQLVAYVGARGLQRIVTFTGHVTDAARNEILATAWMLALPSLKEGWGLVIGEAAGHGATSLAYRAAGGTNESIDDGVTGLLADDHPDFVAKLRRLIEDHGYREKLSENAERRARGYTWQHATDSFDRIIDAAVNGLRPVGADGSDPDDAHAS